MTTHPESHVLNEKPCGIDGCSKPAITRGWCKAHYERWRRHGNPLTRKRPANGEPQDYFREVVLAYEGDECLTWPFSTARGYGQVWWGGRIRIASRIICGIVHGDPPTPSHEAAHSCGKGHEGCVTKRHLSWKTSAENKADQLIHGTRTRKVTEAQVLEIRALNGIKSQSKIAEQFNLSASHVSGINSGKRWAWMNRETNQ